MTTVLTETRDQIAWITLNRPEAMNALSVQLRAELAAALRAAEADPEVRVVVLRGAGDRAFCAGADIKEFVEVPSPPAYRQARVPESWITPFDLTRKPIVASIHGYCLGGGLEVALACDIRIAAEDAQFGLPETGLGIMTGVGGSQRLPRMVGLAQALDMILTGDRIDGVRAREIGLVTRVVPRPDLAAETEALALRLAARPPMAMAFAKEAVRAAQDLPLRDGMRLEIDLITHLLNTEDRLEAARAFREKRKPHFTGR
ncbi:enoyl-CoA hydratase/isomerase family protein [Roseomonas stagni]|uniref:Enoyl-CoA hydratase/isomerase family protein n=1 Tax=Falsiroseomonas algicola TaxID=2716930 RepID=A0A6M1LHP1_9PROT|nr:enoyl-CoA hydratase-related protein [Falsiroseomonas algicola]NGM19652.1 enoyl-CoA hydratase/isomerase family protein [Falsiroseomonas algicola]